MIYLIYQLAGHVRPRAHIARATTLDAVLFGGDYRCICGAVATPRRRWNVAERTEAELCPKCVRKAAKP